MKKIKNKISFKEKLEIFKEKFGYCSNCTRLMLLEDDKCKHCGSSHTKKQFPNRKLLLHAFNNYKKRLYWL